MIIAGTGHRPDKLLYKYSSKGVEFLEEVATMELKALNPEKVITGMALGWDTGLAIAAIRMGIPIVAAVPFKGQEKAWPERSQEIYHRILDKAELVHIVCEGEYSSYKMQVRNEWMVDHCDLVLALWNGTDGGTANCVRYAEKQGKKFLNAWDTYERLLPPWDV